MFSAETLIPVLLSCGTGLVPGATGIFIGYFWFYRVLKSEACKFYVTQHFLQSFIENIEHQRSARYLVAAILISIGSSVVVSSLSYQIFITKSVMLLNNTASLYFVVVLVAYAVLLATPIYCIQLIEKQHFRGLHEKEAAELDELDAFFNGFKVDVSKIETYGAYVDILAGLYLLPWSKIAKETVNLVPVAEAVKLPETLLIPAVEEPALQPVAITEIPLINLQLPEVFRSFDSDSEFKLKAWRVLSASEDFSSFLCQCSCGAQEQIPQSQLSRKLAESCRHLEVNTADSLETSFSDV